MKSCPRASGPRVLQPHVIYGTTTLRFASLLNGDAVRHAGSWPVHSLAQQQRVGEVSSPKQALRIAPCVNASVQPPSTLNTHHVTVSFVYVLVYCMHFGVLSTSLSIAALRIAGKPNTTVQMLLIRGSPAVLPVGKSGSKPHFAPPPVQRLRAAPFRPVKVERRHALHCRAEGGRNSAVTDIRKIDTEKGSLQHQLRETVLTPETLVPVALGVGGALLAGYGQDGALIGEARLLRYKPVLGRRSLDLAPTVL